MFSYWLITEIKSDLSIPFYEPCPWRGRRVTFPPRLLPDGCVVHQGYPPAASEYLSGQISLETASDSETILRLRARIFTLTWDLSLCSLLGVLRGYLWKKGKTRDGDVI